MALSPTALRPLLKTSPTSARRSRSSENRDARTKECFRLVVSATAILTFSSVGSVIAVSADTTISNLVEAHDVCPADEDPCLIDQEFRFDSDVVLDFGTRSVNIQPGGRLKSEGNSIALLCGGFVSSVGSTTSVIDTRGAGTGAGQFLLEARRRCSANTRSLCFSNSDCDSGSCSTHQCSGDPAAACDFSSDCNFGRCINRRCTGDFSRSCDEDIDCQPGPCLIQTNVCSAQPSRHCLSDSDCSDGACSVGTASVAIDGRIFASGNDHGGAGAIAITAADNITYSGVINVEGNARDNDGGIVRVRSGMGSVTGLARINATSGRFGTGGDVIIDAGHDVLSTKNIDARGGDFDGGLVHIKAGRDIGLTGSVTANSYAGEGYGGSVICEAGRNLSIGFGVRIDTSGHQGNEGFCGDAGPQFYDAAGNATVETGATLEANGAAPDCAGDFLSIAASADITVHGTLEAGSVGEHGSGGWIELNAGHDLHLARESRLDVGGGTGGAGRTEIVSANDATLLGTIDASAMTGEVSGLTGRSGSINVSTSRDASVGGDIQLAGVAFPGSRAGLLEIDSCSLTLVADGVITNETVAGRNHFIGRRAVVSERGNTTLAAPDSGINRVVFRDRARPPLLQGDTVPAALTILDERLEPCRLCGNGEVDEGETCDAVATTPEEGSFCSDECQMLACGDPDNSGDVRASDALVVLGAAVGLRYCHPCVCNVDGKGGASQVTATDALHVLSFAVGLGRELVCPVCPTRHAHG